jgi:DUF4097 and DUF4098 domain-containing protein YvlB
MKTILLTIQLALVALVAMSQTSKYSFKETYEVGANPTLAFSSEDGDIRISSSVEKQITVHFIAKKNNNLLNISMNELKEYFNITIANNEEGLNVEVRSKQKNNIKNWRNRVTLDFEIFTPVKTACDLHAVDGDLSMKGLEADQQCKTVDGDIEFQGIKGDLTASTVDGDVDMQETTGAVDIRTTDGDLKLNHVTGNVRTKTIDGDVEFQDLKGGLISSATDGDIRGNMTDLKAPCACHTTDGDIHLTLPAGTSFNIDMKGESLHADLKGFEGDRDDKHIKGKVNGGGVSIALSASDGDIRLMFE